MTTKAVLDSWAVLRWINAIEPAQRAVRQALRNGAAMSWINVGEVAYIVEREAGRAVADVTVSQLRAKVTLLDATPRRVLAAARVKASHPMSLAAAFAVAAALELGVPLPTGDPEIIDSAVPGLRVRDLR